MTQTPLSLPERQLRLTPKSLTGTRGAPFLILVFLVIAGALVWWQAPGLWRDWQISRNPVTWDGQISNGECTTRKAFFTDCEAHLAWQVDGKSYESDVAVMFVDIHSGDYWVDLVISGDKPELATMSLAIEKLWNRIIVLSCFIALFGGLAILSLWQGIRARRESARLALPGRLTPVLVDIGSAQKGRAGHFVGYSDPAKPNRSLMTRFEPDQEPLVVVDGGGMLRGVAVRHDGAALPALLDSRLARLDLTEAEREAALEPLVREQAPREVEKGPGFLARFLRGLRIFLGVILLLVLLVLGYWLYYVTSGPSQYDDIGMEVNNILPAGMNEWGCAQLQKRFGDQNAPFGCTAPDHVSWK